MADYYQTLGLDKSASAEEIKRAYRKLAHQHHPDKQGGDEKKFKEINEAYQVLADPKKREQYDRFGPNFAQGGFGGQGSQGFDGFDFSQFGFGREGFDVEDIFDMFGGVFGGSPFGGRTRARERENRGADLETAAEISFYESARGGVRNVEIANLFSCPECGGSGAKPSEGLIDCSVCSGKGEIRETSASLFGNITRIRECNVCKGSGQVPKVNCPACLGEGRKKANRKLEITIPAGIANGQVLVVKGKGQAGFRGGPAGDLYLRIKVEPDKKFKRLGSDLLYELPLKLTDALLGARVRVPPLDGDKEIEIPSGIHDGEELRLKGYGIHSGRNPASARGFGGQGKGDQIVKIKLVMPRKLGGKAKKLVEELSREL